MFAGRYAPRDVITSRIYRDGALQDESPFDPAAVAECRESGDRHIWIDVVSPTDDELSLLQQTLSLHELSIEDSRRWGQR
jgi:Mg2+ and Co2+ transporter CorA